MSTSYGSKIVNDGLVLYFDVANTKSLKFPNKIYDDSVWTVGTSGSQGDFEIIYSNCSSIITEADPWGNLDNIWKSDGPGDGTYPSLGGIYCKYKSIDNTKLYRMSWWENRVTNSTATYGVYYAGLNGSPSGVIQRSVGGVPNKNPYFCYKNHSSFASVLNTWFLVVGHIWPAGSGIGSQHEDSGWWYQNGTKWSTHNYGDWVWDESTTTARPRTLAIYRGNDVGMVHHTSHVRMDLCDGTEPSLDDLLNNVPSKLYDLSGNNNIGTQIGIPKYNSDNNGYFEFDGVEDYIDCGSDSSLNLNELTISAWINPTVIESAGFWNRIVEKGQNSQYGLSVTKASNYGLVFRVVNTESSLNTFVSNYIPTEDVWTQIVVTYNGTSVKMYADTIEKYSNPFTDTIITTDSSLKIGNWNDMGRPFNGNIANVSIYNRALSPTEISQNYNALKGRFGL